MNLKSLTISSCIIALLFSSCGSTRNGQKEEITLNTQMDTVSYSIGVSVAKNLKLEEAFKDINIAALYKGIKDSYGEEELFIDETEANKIVTEHIKKSKNKKFDVNIKAGNDFLEANKTKEGVVTLPSGLQYIVMKEGDGPQPQLTDKVTTHYHGTLIDGKIFDSSVDRGEPISFPVNGVIAGWTEALQLMKVGSKWKLFIPSQLAYGENPRPGGIIEPNMALVFEVELISIND